MDTMNTSVSRLKNEMKPRGDIPTPAQWCASRADEHSHHLENAMITASLASTSPFLRPSTFRRGFPLCGLRRHLQYKTAFKPAYTLNRKHGSLLCKAQQEPEKTNSFQLDRNGLALAAGGIALVLALAITSNREDIADAIFDEGFRGGFSGDTLGAVLWSTSLYFCSPWQTLLIFLGRVDTERPSDWTLNLLAKAAGMDNTAEDFSYPLAIRGATIFLFACAGALVASSLSAALGDATWSVSTGLGSCLIAAIYEVGRPARLTADEANVLESQYQDFAKFADERLQPRGNCHESEVFKAFRASDARYRQEEVLSDANLRQFIRNWAKQYVYPTAERSSNGYFKRISLRERIDPFSGERTGVAEGARKQ